VPTNRAKVFLNARPNAARSAKWNCLGKRRRRRSRAVKLPSHTLSNSNYFPLSGTWQAMFDLIILFATAGKSWGEIPQPRHAIIIRPDTRHGNHPRKVKSRL
jgi:hypothetical protein